VTRDQLAYVLRAVARISGDRDVLIVGSQSILGSYPGDVLPPEATGSMGVDTAFFPDGWRDRLVGLDTRGHPRPNAPCRPGRHRSHPEMDRQHATHNATEPALNSPANPAELRTPIRSSEIATAIGTNPARTLDRLTERTGSTASRMNSSPSTSGRCRATSPRSNAASVTPSPTRLWTEWMTT
jgi:hypothetical protein